MVELWSSKPPAWVRILLSLKHEENVQQKYVIYFQNKFFKKSYSINFKKYCKFKSLLVSKSTQTFFKKKFLLKKKLTKHYLHEQYVNEKKYKFAKTSLLKKKINNLTNLKQFKNFVLFKKSLLIITNKNLKYKKIISPRIYRNYLKNKFSTLYSKVSLLSD